MAKRGVTITPLKGRDEVKKRKGKKGIKLARRRPPPVYIDRPRYDTMTDRRMTALNGVTHYSPIRRWSSYIGPGLTTKKLQETKIHRTIFGLPGPRPTLLQSFKFFSLDFPLCSSSHAQKRPRCLRRLRNGAKLPHRKATLRTEFSGFAPSTPSKHSQEQSHAIIRLRARIRYPNRNFHLRF